MTDNLMSLQGTVSSEAQLRDLIVNFANVQLREMPTVRNMGRRTLEFTLNLTVREVTSRDEVSSEARQMVDLIMRGPRARENRRNREFYINRIRTLRS